MWSSKIFIFIILSWVSVALLLSVVCTGLKSITLFLCVPSYLWVCGSHYPWKKIVCFQIPVMLFSLPKRLVFASVWHLWTLMIGNISNVVPNLRFLAPSRLWYPGCRCTQRPIYKNNFYDFFPFHFSSLFYSAQIPSL